MPKVTKEEAFKTITEIDAQIVGARAALLKVQAAMAHLRQFVRETESGEVVAAEVEAVPEQSVPPPPLTTRVDRQLSLPVVSNLVRGPWGGTVGGNAAVKLDEAQRSNQAKPELERAKSDVGTVNPEVAGRTALTERVRAMNTRDKQNLLVRLIEEHYADFREAVESELRCDGDCYKCPHPEFPLAEQQIEACLVGALDELGTDATQE